MVYIIVIIIIILIVIVVIIIIIILIVIIIIIVIIIMNMFTFMLFTFIVGSRFSKALTKKRGPFQFVLHFLFGHPLGIHPRFLDRAFLGDNFKLAEKCLLADQEEVYLRTFKFTPKTLKTRTKSSCGYDFQKVQPCPS